MNIFAQDKMTSFFSHALAMKRDLNEWRMIHVVIPATQNPSVEIDSIVEKIKDIFSSIEGAIYIENNRQLLVFAKLGHAFTAKKLEADLADKLTGFKKRVRILPPDVEQLKRLEITLMQESEHSIFRSKREKKVIMIIDDDLFIRSLISNALKLYGTIVHHSEGALAVETYKKELPDVVFLDIHLPGTSGLALLKEILSFDPLAQVVMVSADSARGNVLDTKSMGAVWFLTKPLTQSKIVDALHKVPEFQQA